MGEPTNYYGLVEEIVESDPQNAHSRSFLLIDSVRADRFDINGPEVIEDRSALALVRAMSTPRRWEERFGLGELERGSWLSFRLDDSGDLPRAWELRADRNYAVGPSRSISEMRRISDPADAPRASDDALVINLMAMTSLPVKRRRRVDASAAIKRLGEDGKIEIIVLDVGQASAVLIKRDGKPIGFFDVGAPIWFNTGSLPKAIRYPAMRGGFVILSHWDFDHFDLGRRHHPYRKLEWFAPDQQVGPNTARFQADLGERLTFIDGSANGKNFSLSRGTSTAPNDRNGSGYQLRYELGARAVLLTGDAGYDSIQPHMMSNVCSLIVPHHGGRSNASPPVSVIPRRAIVSYGDPNSYRHPHSQTLIDHQTKGWRIANTASTSLQPRGNRQLFP